MLGILSRSAAFAFGGIQAALWSTGAEAAVATPFQSQRRLRNWRAAAEPLAADWNLVRDEQSVREAGGRLMYLFGQVLNFDGEPQRGVRVELWQRALDGRCPYDGKSLTQGDADAAFRAFGSCTSDDFGTYRFRTIRPVGVECEAPTLHARITPQSGRARETQLYLLDEPLNDRDWLFASLGPSRQAALSIDPVERGNGDLEAGFNFVI